MYSAFECSRVAAGPDGSADRSQTDSRVLSSHDPKTVFPIDGLDRFASMSSSPLQFVNAVTSPLLFLAEPFRQFQQAQAPDRCHHGPCMDGARGARGI